MSKQLDAALQAVSDMPRQDNSPNIPMNELDVVMLRIRLAPIWQLIGYAKSADQLHISQAWRTGLLEIADASEKILKEAFQ